MNNVGSTTLLHPVFINLEQVIIFRRVEKSRPKKLHSRKNLSKVVNSQNLVENVLLCGKYSLTKFANFLIVLRTEIATTFGPKNGCNFRP